MEKRKRERVKQIEREQERLTDREKMDNQKREGR